MTLLAPVPLEQLTEKEFASQVFDLAKGLGWLRYHVFFSQRSAPGWPDEALVRERLLLIELKKENGKVSDAQKVWVGRLLRTSTETYIARPRHLELLKLILACHGDPFEKRGDVRDAAAELRASTKQEVGDAT